MMDTVNTPKPETHDTSTPENTSGYRLEPGPDGVHFLVIDIPGERQNVLKAHFGEAFEALLAQVERDPAIKALVLISGKSDSFMAGADLKAVGGAPSAQEATELSLRGQASFQRLAELLPQHHKPVVAAIHGACLGGGLELALACHARIATDDRKTELALPEVQLGLMPAGGGTQRLPRLIGITAALDLLLTGKKLKGSKALKLGIVDEVVPRAHLKRAAVAKALALLAEPPPPSNPFLRFQNALTSLGQELPERMLEDTPIGRKILFQQARKQLKGKTLGNYPAPERILDAVEIGMDRGMAEGMKAEARLFGEVVVTPQARELLNLFFATLALKKDSGVDDPSVKARDLHRVGMLGAGLMGSGIAYVTSSLAERPIRIKDRDDAAVVKGLKAVHELYRGRVKRKSLSKHEASLQFARVTGTTTYQGFERCDVVIEAVFESLELKHQMVRDTEAITPATTIFASNTSSIPITQIAEASSRPETVIGMHYFSPVDKMPLLEVIVTGKTAPWVVASCVELGKKQGKNVIVVKDGVGFYTSRILAPYMNEAAQLLSEGVAIERIDQALKQWGFPVGPITLMDEVGIDVGEKVGHIMIAAFGDRMAPPPTFEKLIQDGRAGRKNKKGFYRYDLQDSGKKNEGKKEVDSSVYKVLGISPTSTLDALEIAERCVFLMVNEALLCYGEGILRSPRDGDLGAIFGLGFPPFRGGPFRFVDTMGAQILKEKLEAFASRLGHRFNPAPVLVEMAKEGKKFYG